MTIPVNSNLVPAHPGKTPYVVEDIYIKGGFRVVATKELRDSIPLQARKPGMIVYVFNMDKYYKLSGDLATWTIWGGPGQSNNEPSFGVMEVVSVSAPTAIASSWFAANSVGAFDVLNCPDAPNYVNGTTTDFMGFHFGSSDGARMLQLGIGILGGTNGIFVRSKTSANTPFGDWVFVKGEHAASSTHDLRPSSNHAKVAHGFALGDALAVDSLGIFIGARSDSPSTCEVVGFVTDVIDADTFELTTPNTYARDLWTGLTPGHVYYVSSTVAGKLVDVVPVTPGFVNKPVMIAVNATSGVILNQRGAIIPQPPTQSTNVVTVNTALIDGVSHLIQIENNSGAVSPLVQIQDNLGYVRNDVKTRVDPSTITFDFTGVTPEPTGMWKAVVYA